MRIYTVDLSHVQAAFLGLKDAVSCVRDLAQDCDDMSPQDLIATGRIDSWEMQAGEKHKSAAAAFKPWIVRRPDGGCQVLFPLMELDRLIAEVLEAAE